MSTGAGGHRFTIAELMGDDTTPKERGVFRDSLFYKVRLLRPDGFIYSKLVSAHTPKHACKAGEFETSAGTVALSVQPVLSEQGDRTGVEDRGAVCGL